MTESLASVAPKYQRIAAAIRDEIRAGVYRPGDRLPAETAFMERFGVSLPTLRQAIGVLRLEGLVESQHGRGTFVRERRRQARRVRHRYAEARRRGGLLEPGYRHEITFAGRGPLPGHVAELMGVAAPSEVVVRRRRLYDPDTGRLEQLGASYLPLAVAAGTYLESAEVVPTALFQCVEELSGRRYRHVRDRWVARSATAEEAGLFELPAGSPVLQLVHTALDADGLVLEVAESVWPADRVLLVDEYRVPLPDPTF